MLIIRFSRVGKKNHAQYRMVVAEKSFPVKGRFVEEVGSYDPHLKQAVIKKERIEYWLSQGVQVSDSVWNLLLKEGVVTGEKRKVKISKKKSGEGAEEKEEGTDGKEGGAKAEDKAVAEEGKAEAGAEEKQEAGVEEKKDDAEAKKEEAKEEAKEETKEEVKEEAKEEKPEVKE